MPEAVRKQRYETASLLLELARDARHYYWKKCEEAEASCATDCILVPIPKDNKDHTKSDNYRGIALAPTLSKLLEWSLLLIDPSGF